MHSILREYDEQRHIANEKQWSYEDGYNKGQEEALQKAIRSLIVSLREMDATFELTKEKIEKNFGLQGEELDTVMKKYWK